jgi:hypothetical protein
VSVVEGYKEEYGRTECKVLVKQHDVLQMLDESEHCFDRAIVDFSRGMEKMFDALKILAEQTDCEAEN